MPLIIGLVNRKTSLSLSDGIFIAAKAQNAEQKCGGEARKNVTCQIKKNK